MEQDFTIKKYNTRIFFFLLSLVDIMYV